NDAISAGISALNASSRIHGPTVDKIAVDQNAELCLNMHDGIQIRIGQIDDLSTKMKLAQRIYALSPQIASQVEAIDLRCPDAPACTPRQANSASKQRESPRSPEPRTHRPQRSSGDTAGDDSPRGTARDREPP